MVVVVEGAAKRRKKPAIKKTKKVKQTVKEEPVDENADLFQDEESDEPVEVENGVLLERWLVIFYLKHPCFSEKITISSLFARFGQLKLAAVIRSLQVFTVIRLN